MSIRLVRLVGMDGVLIDWVGVDARGGGGVDYLVASREHLGALVSSWVLDAWRRLRR